jgi:hypothetical protein
MGKQNKELFRNIELYEQKKKAEQQKSKILEQNSNTGEDNKKKRTRMYHI